MLPPASSRAERRIGYPCASPSSRQRGVRRSGILQTLNRPMQMLRQPERSQLRAHQRQPSVRLQAEVGRSSELVQGVLLCVLFPPRAAYAA